MGPADPGLYTRTPGFWSYYEVCLFINSSSVTEVNWMDKQMVPYATAYNSWVGYDDKESFAAKVQWLSANNLGGASVWTLDFDDFNGAHCADGAYPLVNQLRTSLGFPPKPTTTVAPTTTTTTAAPSFCSGRPDGLYPNPADHSTYFQCFRGHTYLHKCQPELALNLPLTVLGQIIYPFISLTFWWSIDVFLILQNVVCRGQGWIRTGKPPCHLVRSAPILAQTIP